MNTILSWDSNPYAYGVIHARMEGRIKAIGGTSCLMEGVKGYLLSKLVYEGDCEEDAMKAVQDEFNKIPEHIMKGLQDD